MKDACEMIRTEQRGKLGECVGPTFPLPAGPMTSWAYFIRAHPL